MLDMNTETPQPEDFASLYRRAFTEYGTRALWNKRELEAPTPADALVVARALRVEGNRESRRLAPPATVTRIGHLARNTFDLFAISAGSSSPGGPSGSSVR